MADRIPVRNPNEISKLRKAGEVSARILMELQEIIRPGITTKDIDDYAAELFKREKCGNAFLGYGGYPGQLCISVNEEIVHGIGGSRVLHDGDIVNTPYPHNRRKLAEIAEFSDLYGGFNWGFASLSRL